MIVTLYIAQQALGDARHSARGIKFREIVTLDIAHQAQGVVRS